MAFAAGIDFGKTDNRGTLCYQFFQSIVIISKRIIMVQFFDAVTIKIGVEALVFSLQACLVGFQFLGGGFVHAFFGKYFYRKNSGLFAGSKGNFALAGFFPFYKNGIGGPVGFDRNFAVGSFLIFGNADIFFALDFTG